MSYSILVPSENDQFAMTAVAVAWRYWKTLTVTSDPDIATNADVRVVVLDNESVRTFAERLVGLVHGIGPTPEPPRPTPDMPIYRIPPTKAGLHISIGAHDGYGDLLRECAAAGRQLGMVKAFEDGGLLEARDLSPLTYRIWRSKARYRERDSEYADNPPYDFDWPTEQTKVVARGWMDACLERWRLNPAQFYELTNEPNVNDRPRFGKFIDFCYACMDIADAEGIKLAIGGFSSGDPNRELIEMMSPLLDDMARRGHVLAIHDGAATPEYRLFKDAHEGGSALRWRLWEEVQYKAGRLMPYVFGTEVYWPEGYLNKNPWDDMFWYWSECGKDQKYLGGAYFELGEYNFGDSRSVNVVGVLPAFGRVVRALPLAEGAIV